ncbi:hypothetical protein [[Eubacterium] hominis]|uniref:hypothetical protein n=1 Tax=[Eubacterium] hominis TaxID=2764325 RepID=UPI003A4D800B
MKQEHKLVYHPKIGICEITEYNQKTKRMTLTSIYDTGNQSTFPFENIKMVGIRDIMTKHVAQQLLYDILHPDTDELELLDPSKRIIEQCIHGPDIEKQVAYLSYMMYLKYAKGNSGVILQTNLGRLEDILINELSYVLGMEKEKLETDMISCYRQLS